MTDKYKVASETGPANLRLGPLERKILEEVWSRESLTVRELLARREDFGSPTRR